MKREVLLITHALSNGRLTVIMLCMLLSACTAHRADVAEAANIELPNGAMIGDVTADSAVFWSRADRDAVMQLELTMAQGGSTTQYFTQVDTATDYAGQIIVTGLRPAQTYAYRIRFRDTNSSTTLYSESINGRFKTAPAPSDSSSVRFAWSGDLAGQNMCRDATLGFPIFNSMRKQQWDFFIGLGDMIYADDLCLATGLYGNQQIAGNFDKAADLPGFWAHWDYSRRDKGFQQLLRQTPYVAVWDDHEVVNDVGPQHDTRNEPPYSPDVKLLPVALQAFHDYNPLLTAGSGSLRTYRNIRWGRHIELFVLDTRLYRDANDLADDPSNAKSMLGSEQLAWLKQVLMASDATWKIIISSVPMSVPTGHPPEAGRDGWGGYDQDTGFNRELSQILRFMHQAGIKNSLWLTTDVHFAAGFRYQPFADDPQFEFYEFIAGPLSAQFFPNKALDRTFGPEPLFYFAPSEELKDYQEAQKYFNFGVVEVAENGDLLVKIINTFGTTVASHKVRAY